MLELEKRQHEFVREYEIEEENLKGIMRLESLKTKTDKKLAEARKIAALIDLEATIVEEWRMTSYMVRQHLVLVIAMFPWHLVTVILSAHCPGNARQRFSSHQHLVQNSLLSLSQRPLQS